MTCQTTNTIEINKGEDKILVLRIRDELNDPYDLTGLTVAEATFKGESSNVVKTLASGAIAISGDPILGKIQVTLNETDTAALEAGANQDFKIMLQKGSDTRIKKVERVLNVIDSTLE